MLDSIKTPSFVKTIILVCFENCSFPESNMYTVPSRGYSTITFNPTTSKYIVKYDERSIETTVTDKAIVADEWVQDIYSKYGASSRVVVGLDVEWRPTFMPNTSNKSATLQLCINDKCLILQLFYMDYFPMSLKRFFMDPRFTFVGIEVDKDIDKLMNEYGFEFSKSEDIREMAKMKWPGRFYRPGLKDLAWEVASVNMKKPKHVCQSNWEARVLSQEQVEYGCMDAFASYCVGHKLLM